MNFNLTYNGTVYTYAKDQNGNGAWYCVRGRVPGFFGKGMSGIMVPTMLSTELSKEAVRQGLVSFKDLNRQIRNEKKPKEKVVRVTSTRKNTGLISSLNIFSLENSVKSDSQIEIEQALEKLKVPTKVIKVSDEEETTELFAELFTSDDIVDEEELEEEIELDLEEVESEIIDVE